MTLYTVTRLGEKFWRYNGDPLVNYDRQWQRDTGTTEWYRTVTPTAARSAVESVLTLVLVVTCVMVFGGFFFLRFRLISSETPRGFVIQSLFRYKIISIIIIIIIMKRNKNYKTMSSIYVSAKSRKVLVVTHDGETRIESPARRRIGKTRTAWRARRRRRRRKEVLLKFLLVGKRGFPFFFFLTACGLQTRTRACSLSP